MSFKSVTEHCTSDTICIMLNCGSLGVQYSWINNINSNLGQIVQLGLMLQLGILVGGRQFLLGDFCVWFKWKQLDVVISEFNFRGSNWTR